MSTSPQSQAERLPQIVNGNWITATLMGTEDQKGLWQITTMPKVDGVDTATTMPIVDGEAYIATM